VPKHKITADAAIKIARWSKSGKSAREIARLLKVQGLQIDQRSVSRFITRCDEPRLGSFDPQESPPESPNKPPQETEISISLDEIAALELRARRIQEVLRDDAAIPIRDMVALNAELRQTFASLRKARAAQREAVGILSADAQATLDRIRKFQRQNQSYPATVEEPAPQDAPIPAATGTDPRR
jgi:hypothetical protein